MICAEIVCTRKLNILLC